MKQVNLLILICVHAFHTGEGRFVANLSTPRSIIANLNNEKIKAFAKAPHFRQPLISNWWYGLVVIMANFRPWSYRTSISVEETMLHATCIMPITCKP